MSRHLWHMQGFIRILVPCCVRSSHVLSRRQRQASRCAVKISVAHKMTLHICTAFTFPCLAVWPHFAWLNLNGRDIAFENESSKQILEVIQGHTFFFQLGILLKPHETNWVFIFWMKRWSVRNRVCVIKGLRYQRLGNCCLHVWKLFVHIGKPLNVMIAASGKLLSP